MWSNMFQITFASGLSDRITVCLGGHVHLYYCFPLVIRSSEKHVNARCKQDLCMLLFYLFNLPTRCPPWVSLPRTPVTHLFITISSLCRICSSLTLSHYFLLCSQYQRVIIAKSERGFCQLNINICCLLDVSWKTDATTSLERTVSLISLLLPQLHLVPLLVFFVHTVDTFTLSC